MVFYIKIQSCVLIRSSKKCFVCNTYDLLYDVCVSVVAILMLKSFEQIAVDLC